MERAVVYVGDFFSNKRKSTFNWFVRRTFGILLLKKPNKTKTNHPRCRIRTGKFFIMALMNVNSSQFQCC